MSEEKTETLLVSLQESLYTPHPERQRERESEREHSRDNIEERGGLKWGEIMASKFWFLAFLAFYLCTEVIQCSVSYDNKAILINGQRRILISGSIHYPRSTPEVISLFSCVS